jgi:general stress protein YciG
MADNSNRGSAPMDEDKQRDTAGKGGHPGGGNFAHDPARAGEAGKKGAAAQPREAKDEGGQHSHHNR